MLAATFAIITSTWPLNSKSNLRQGKQSARGVSQFTSVSYMELPEKVPRKTLRS